MRIIVLGAGAIGSTYGARLSKHHDVTLIGGASHVEGIQRDGLVMAGEATGTFRLPAFTSGPGFEPGRESADRVELGELAGRVA